MTLASAFLCLVCVLVAPQDQTLPDEVPIVNQSSGWERLHNLNKWLIGSNMVLVGVDYGQTMYLVGTGQFSEATPWLRWAENRPVSMGLVKIGTGVAVSAAALRMNRNRPHAVFWVMVGAIAINATVNILNYQKYQDYKRAQVR